MKKRILSIVLAVALLASTMTAFSLSSFAAETVISVSSRQELEAALTAPGTATIKLTKNIECSHKMGSDGHTAWKVSGTKTLDLNGHTITCKDESNAKDHGFKVNKSHWFTDCYATEGNKKTLIEVPSGASLTIDDTGKNGGISFTGKTVGLMFDAYYDRKHYNGYTTRDLFNVNGTLTINNGILSPGNTSEHWVSNGVNFDEWGSKIYVHFTAHAHEQIFGSVASVGAGGKLIVNGGTLTGQGIEATVNTAFEKPGNVLDWIDGFDSAEEGFGTVVEIGESLGVLESESNEYVIVQKRDEVIEVKGGNVTVNGGKFIAQNGANVFGGTPAGKVKITAGRFEFESKDYLRVIDYEYHSGKYYGTVIKGRYGAFGADASAIDANTTFVAIAGTTYTDAEAIKGLGLEKLDSTIVIGEKEEHSKTPEKKKIAFTSIQPAIADEDSNSGIYGVYEGETIDYLVNILPLTAEEKAAGYTVKKLVRLMGAQPSNGSVKEEKISRTDEPAKLSHTFDQWGWYEILVAAHVYDGAGNTIGSNSYTYNLIVYKAYKSIELTTPPKKTTYEVGEKLDTTGMVITANMSDGEKYDITKFVKVLQDDAVRAGQTYFVVEFVVQENEADEQKFILYVPITVNEPKAEEPKTEEPKQEEPKQEEPKAEEPPAITIENIFIDVTTVNWFYNDVLLAVQLGLVNGKSANEYRPDDNLTYAEAIKLAACMHQLYTEGEITITPGNPWYQPYVDYCKDNEIIDKEYAYTDVATRAGYMSIFANALPADALKVLNNVPDNSIPDVSMSEIFAQAVYKLYRAGILQGMDDAHSCMPHDNIKRSEVAAILARMMYSVRRVKFTMTGEEWSQPLTIKKQPGSKSARPGESATFTVEAEGGKAPYSYQWMHEVGGAKKQVVPISNETAATIVRTAPSENGSTKCHCVITDANGDTVTSEEAVLTGIRVESSGGAKDKFRPAEPTVDTQDKGFLMYVEDVFTVTGKGVIATGRIAKGELKVGDTIKIIAADGTAKTTTVAGIEMFRKSLTEAEKGDNIGLLFGSEIEKGMVQRGETLVGATAGYDIVNTLVGTVTLLTKEEGGRTNAIENGFLPQLYYSGNDITGALTGFAGGSMKPGETQENITVKFTSHNGIWYVGQTLEIRQAGRKLGTFTVTEVVK